jgi:hypothetical protein
MWQIFGDRWSRLDECITCELQLSNNCSGQKLHVDEIEGHVVFCYIFFFTHIAANKG